MNQSENYLNHLLRLNRAGYIVKATNYLLFICGREDEGTTENIHF